MVNGTIILTACCCLSLFPAAGQRTNYLFRHIGQPDGLLDNKVAAFAQDRRGFIWIGSYNGLQRYDGIRFVNYRDLMAGEAKNLTGVTRIDTASGNRLFFYLGWKGRRLDWETNTVSPYSSADISEDTAGRRRYEDGSHNFWIIGEHAIYYQDAGKAKLLHFPPSYAKDSSFHQVWAMGGGVLLLLDSTTGKAYSPAWNPLRHPLLRTVATMTLKSMLLDSRHKLWINSWADRFFQYDLVAHRLRTYSVSALSWGLAGKPSGDPRSVNAFYEDHHGVLWLATAGLGLLRYCPGDGHFEAVARQQENSRGIQYSYEIYCIFQDREDNIWLGTDRGISLFNPYKPNFRILTHEDQVQNGLPDREIVGFTQLAKGDLLVGTWGGGITVYDKRLEFKKNIRFPGDIDRNMIWNFLELDGKIWVGCQHGWLHIYDSLHDTWSTLHPEALQHSTVRCMQKDAGGNVFFGLHNGRIAWWDKRDQTFHVSKDGPGPAAPAGPVNTIYFDSRQRCWVCTESGLRQFDQARGMYTATWSPGGDQPAICLSLAEQDDSTLLVGIMRGGISLFHKERGQFGLPLLPGRYGTLSVQAIHKDAGAHTWFTTDYGLHRLDPGKRAPIDYWMEPGAVRSAFASAEMAPLQDGRWLTATTSEIVGFYPDSLDKEGMEPLPVAITGLKLLDRGLFIDSFLLKKKTIPLGYRQNFITIEFAALRFSSPRQIGYRYRLSGVDRGWVNADITGTAGYTNLSPGNYIFEVRAEDGSGQGPSNFFSFYIAPPFWQTWWFRAAVLLSIAFLIYLLVRRRIGVIRREAALQQQIAETEVMALRAQMNPHFIFNCINSIDALIQSNDKYHATLYLNKFAKLIRNVLDSSRQNTVPLGKDLETLKLYIELEQFRNDHRFTCEIAADEGLLRDDYRVPPLIIQPYVENAILHGLRSLPEGRGRLFISVDRQDGYLTYIVEDNGVGRSAVTASPKLEKQSYGMQMTSDRVRLFNKEPKASIEIADLCRDGQPTGTRVKLSLRIQ